MFVYLAISLMAPPQGAVELRVYRSASELPPLWAKVLPADFDFGNEMLASSASPAQRVELVAGARVERPGTTVYVAAPREQVEPPRECPPCRGVQDSPDWGRLQKSMVPPREVALPPLFRLARAPGRVFRLPAGPLAAVFSRDCPPCLAP
ncbi:MAG: hypothetical protein Q8L48_00950 [Archangium sp.]|nr:hypothetical protein [Archangium sp.]